MSLVMSRIAPDANYSCATVKKPKLLVCYQHGEIGAVSFIEKQFTSIKFKQIVFFH